MPPVDLGFVAWFLVAWMAHGARLHRARVGVLLLTSYGAVATIDVRLAALLAIVTLVNFALTRTMQQLERGAVPLALLVAVDALLLAALDHLSPGTLAPPSDPARGIFDEDAPRIEPIFALGASFYVLQAIAYACDVRSGRIPRPATLSEYALLLCFLPKLAAGPTVDAASFLAQVREPATFRADRFVSGMRAILEGVFLKAVVANRLAAFNDAVFADRGGYYGFALVVAALLFVVQFASEVAGYLRMAHGASLLLGIDLGPSSWAPRDRPGPGSIWSGWYPELARWWDARVQAPLEAAGLGRAGAVVLGFALLGAWHRVRIDLVLVGVYFGLVALLVRATRSLWERRVRSRIGWVIAVVGGRIGLLCLVAVGLVCLRLESVSSGSFFLANAGSAILDVLHGLSDLGRGKGIVGPMPGVVHEGQMIFPMLIVGLLGIGGLALRRETFAGWLDRRPRPLRWVIYGLQLWAILTFGRFGETPFLYARL